MTNKNTLKCVLSGAIASITVLLSATTVKATTPPPYPGCRTANCADCSVDPIGNCRPVITPVTNDSDTCCNNSFIVEVEYEYISTVMVPKQGAPAGTDCSALNFECINSASVTAVSGNKCIEQLMHYPSPCEEGGEDI